ncbi:MAG: metal-dependent phosphohydrolase, partial [Microcoleus sp.]
MFNPTAIVTNSLTESLKAGYRNTYGNLKSDTARLIEQSVNLTLGNIARSSALYHNVEHTVLVTLVGQEILRGKYICEGNISREHWLEAIVSWLCHDIGYVAGICSGDRHSQRLYVTGNNSDPIYLELNQTDASLTPFHVDRSKMFVQEHFSDSDAIDVRALMQNIELTRFPVPNDAEHSCTSNYPGLVRAADLIGQLSDPRYLQKMPALFYEFEEIGTNKNLGYRNPGDLRAGYPKFFRNVVSQYIGEGLHYLALTPAGQKTIANLYG